jgi:hypothetical protein
MKDCHDLKWDVNCYYIYNVGLYVNVSSVYGQ